MYGIALSHFLNKSPIKSLAFLKKSLGLCETALGYILLSAIYLESGMAKDCVKALEFAYSIEPSAEISIAIILNKFFMCGAYQ